MAIKRHFLNVCLTVLALLTIGNMQAANYFVKVNGSGDKSGSSWDNAMDLECFRTAVHDQAIDNDVFYLAGGLYRPNPETVLQTDHLTAAIYFLSIKEKGISLIGGFDPNITGSTTSITYPTSTPTIFSGDKNNDGETNDGDCRVLYIRAKNNYEKKVTLKGLRITGGYQATASDRKPGVSVATGSMVDIFYCTFDNNSNPLTATNPQAGGAALSVRDHSNVYCYKCVFENNNSNNRGGAIRCSDNAGGNNTLILESCLVNNNSTTGAFGGAIQATHADVFLINTTVTGNTTGGHGAVVNGSARWHFINSTIANNTCTANSDYGYDFRCETVDSYIYNSIIVNSADINNFKLETPDKGLVSGGYNLLGKKGGNGVVTTTGTDATGLLYPAVFGTNTLALNYAADDMKTIAVETNKPGATLEQLTAYVNEDTYWKEIKNRLSPDWNTKDARGVARPTSAAITIGAFQYPADPTTNTISTISKQYAVYPTLLDDVLHIEVEEKTSVSIVNIAGKVIYSTIGKGTVSISTANYPKGIYFVNTGGEITKVLKK